MSENTPPSDPRLGFLELISLEKSHVHFDPPLILLFGGDMTQEYGSFRERLNHFATTRSQLSMISPEDFTDDWLHGSKYNDLLEFEFDLAHLSTYLVIILETAGSIAELGSFAVNPSFSDKVIVVMEEEHYDKGSFIELGPLKRFKDDNILVLPVSFLRPQRSSLQETQEKHMSSEEYQYSLKLVLDHLDELIIPKNKSSKKFSRDDVGHLSFLVYEMVNMFLALKPKEIQDYLTKLEITIEKKKVTKILYLLLKLDLLECKRQGSETYYFCRSPENFRFILALMSFKWVNN